MLDPPRARRIAFLADSVARRRALKFSLVGLYSKQHFPELSENAT